MSAVRGRTARLALVAVAAVLVLVAWWWVGQGSGGQAAQQDRGSPSISRSSTAPGADSTAPGADSTAPRADSGPPTVQAADLPAQARRTLGLIAAGGPYPYSRDGVVFQNRERLLPRKASGYYHEYTVPTPGEGDRGARRIITGKGGELYWTADHYASFQVIEGGVP